MTPLFMHVTIELKYGKVEGFLETMPKVQAIVESAGWRLEHALMQVSGKLFTVRHVWKLRDFAHYAEGMGVFMAHPDFAALSAALAEVVETETIAHATALPYAHNG